jgi:hypothetical protein
MIVNKVGGDRGHGKPFSHQLPSFAALVHKYQVEIFINVNQIDFSTLLVILLITTLYLN